MKPFAIFAFALTVVLSPATGLCAYPSLVEAQTMFSSEMMNSLENTPPNPLYDDFVSRFGEPSSPEDSLAVETAVLQGVASIVINISTNAVDDGTPAWIPSYRGAILGRIAPNLRDFPTNAVNCLSIASYAGTVATIDFPDDLVNKRFNGHVFYQTTNEVGQTIFRERTEWREELMARQRLQVRVRQMNKAVADYRRTLMEVCSIGVAGCRGVMDDAEFATFTNQVVMASGANELELAILFRGLGGEVQSN